MLSQGLNTSRGDFMREKLIVLGFVLAIFCFYTSLGFAADPSPNVSSQTTVQQLKDLFSEHAKVNVHLVGPLILVDGEVEEPLQLVRINEVVASLKEATVPIKSLVHISPENLKRVALQIEREVNTPNIGVMLRFVNSYLIVEGTLESDFQADRTLAIVRGRLARPAFGDELSRNYSSTTGNRVGEAPVIPGIVIVDMMQVRPKKEKAF